METLFGSPFASFSILWGPVLLICDGSPGNQMGGLIITPLLMAAILSPAWKPSVVTVGLSLIAAVAWLYVGLMASGINC